MVGAPLNFRIEVNVHKQVVKIFHRNQNSVEMTVAIKVHKQVCMDLSQDYAPSHITRVVVSEKPATATYVGMGVWDSAWC